MEISGRTAISSSNALSRISSTDDTRSAIPSFDVASPLAVRSSDNASFVQSPHGQRTQTPSSLQRTLSHNRRQSRSRLSAIGSQLQAENGLRHRSKGTLLPAVPMSPLALSKTLPFSADIPMGCWTPDPASS